MRILRTRQAVIQLLEDGTVEKVFRENRNNSLSSVEHEVSCIEKFSCNGTNIHAPRIIKFDNKSYIMERYDFPLGILTKIDENYVRRMLFTISINEVVKQLDQILDILKKKKIRHHDINPGNLLFSEREKAIKLIDFFWAETEKKKVREPAQLNLVYGTNDEKAIEIIKHSIIEIDKRVQKKMNQVWKPIVQKLGMKYYNRSSLKKGRKRYLFEVE